MDNYGENFYKDLTPDLIKSYWNFLGHQPTESDLIDPYWQMAGMGLLIHNNLWSTKESK